MPHPLTKTAFVTGVVLSLTVYGKSLAQQQVTQASIAEQLLAAHNRYRAEVGVSPLGWSEALASQAQERADQLAATNTNTLQSSQISGEGENFWLGPSDYFSYTDMVDSWGDEKQYFRYGTLPDVSATGNWADVRHYTQLIWQGTTEVGCGMAKAEENTILVCRYNPPGNSMGQVAYSP